MRDWDAIFRTVEDDKMRWRIDGVGLEAHLECENWAPRERSDEEELDFATAKYDLYEIHDQALVVAKRNCVSHHWEEQVRIRNGRKVKK